MSSDCDDNNPCNGVETCNIAAGTCVGGTPVDCSSLDDDCNNGSCNQATGACIAVPKADGTGCSDGNACTQTDTCQGGSCTGSNPVICTALDQCHDVGTCNPSTGVCSNPNKADGSSCNDSDLCTQTDTCQSGSCVGMNPVVCTPLDQCHDAGVCNPSTGICTNPNKADGSSCNDGDLCTQTDTCQSGVCTGSNPVVCMPLDQCHVAGTCNSSTGMCTNPNATNGTGCNDGSQCTQMDVCTDGSCGGTARDNANFDWNDDPGGSDSGPDSIDVFSFGDGRVGVVGSYRGTVTFDKDAPQSLGLGATCSAGLYLAVYKEQGGIEQLHQIGCVQGAATAGTFTVTHATAHPDDGFTIIGSFLGTGHFGKPGATISRSGSNYHFIARYDSDGSIRWVGRGIPSASSTIDAVSTLDEDSTVVVGTAVEGIDFHDGSDKFAFSLGIGVWTLRFDPDGSLPYGKIVVSPAGGNFVTARGITGEDSKQWSMTGDFQGTHDFGPNADRRMSSQAGTIDTWAMELRSDGSYLWAARVGGSDDSTAGDITRLPGGATMLITDSTGDSPSANDPFMTLMLRSVDPNWPQTNVLRFETDGKLTGAALIARTKETSRGWQIGTDATGNVTVAGTFTSPMDLYGNVGFGGGAPSGGADFTLTGAGPSTLFVGRADTSCRWLWAVTARGDGSGMTTQAGFDVVQTDHPSQSITIGGMFTTSASFGDAKVETLTPGDTKNGSPFVVHLNSEAEYDYCP